MENNINRKPLTFNLSDYLEDDIKRDTLTYNATSSDTNILKTDIEGSILKLTGVSKGSATVTVIVHDGDEDFTQKFNVKVINTDTLTYTIVSSDTNILKADMEGSILKLTGVSNGAATITVTAHDGDEETTQSFNVKVINTIPVYSDIPTQSISRNQSIILNLSDYYSDVDGDNLTFEVSSKDNDIVTASLSDSELTLTGVSKGLVDIVINVSDGTTSISNAFSVNVGNTSPSYVTIPLQSTQKNQTIMIDLSNYFSDIDGDALTYDVNSSDSSKVIANVDGSKLTLIGVSKGSAIITVKCSDGIESIIKVFDIDVLNTIPLIPGNFTFSKDTVERDENIVISWEPSSDVDNDIIQYSLQYALDNTDVYNDISTDTTTSREFIIPSETKDTIKFRVQAYDGTEYSNYRVSNPLAIRIPPILRINEIIPSGTINSDKFVISGVVASENENPIVSVTYKINGKEIVKKQNKNTYKINSIEDNDVYTGSGGEWGFEIALGDLKTGENVVDIEAIDNYDAKTTKTIKLNKNENATQIKKSVVRYKLENMEDTPSKEILLFIERDDELEIDVEISMTSIGEEERFEKMILDDSKPLNSSEGKIEDVYYYNSGEEKENIVIKITTIKENVYDDHKIYLISGTIG